MKHIKRTACLTTIAAALAVGTFSMPATAVDSDLGTVGITLESILQDPDLSDDEAAAKLLELKKSRYLSGRQFVRKPPKPGGRGSSPVVPQKPQEPVSPYQP